MACKTRLHARKSITVYLKVMKSDSATFYSLSTNSPDTPPANPIDDILKRCTRNNLPTSTATSKLSTTIYSNMNPERKEPPPPLRRRTKFSNKGLTNHLLARFFELINILTFTKIRFKKYHQKSRVFPNSII